MSQQARIQLVRIFFGDKILCSYLCRQQANATSKSNHHGPITRIQPLPNGCIRHRGPDTHRACANLRVHCQTRRLATPRTLSWARPQARSQESWPSLPQGGEQSGTHRPRVAEQIGLLRLEGVAFRQNGLIDLSASLWHPEEDSY